MNDHRDLWWKSPTVDLGQVVELDLSEPFRAVHGGELPDLQVSYESWGELNAARDNAVLIIHPMTADCHATGEFDGQPMGWWESLIGPGRAINTDRQFVVCPNLIGGCYGTTGPRFPAPDGDPYHERFPLLTPLDMMRVQRLFMEALKIRRFSRIIGPSMGGMIAWEWAIEAPELVEQVVVVAAPLKTSAYQIGLNWLQRRGIELDMSENEFVARQGQMIARGVGMLSYRSPVGMDEKFGRDWFKPPGETLGDRGMYNVESWLRHHGKRITKRYDPYTYLLYSRAMDLHDVSVGRGDLMAALDRVTCRTLVIGISTDNLYPSDEVRHGSLILRHLGRDVRFSEIRSPSGHDAFLLDTDQIEDFLREPSQDEARAAAGVDQSKVREISIGILGAGMVAASFVRLIEERREQLLASYGLSLRVKAVCDLDPDREHDPVFEGISFTTDPDRLVRRDDLDVIVELTRGPDSYPIVENALSRGIPVVTPNKSLIRSYGESLERIALENGVRLAYRDSIASGWPLLYAVERPLTRGRIVGIRAVLSSACNVILERIAGGVSFEEALADAVSRDLTEPDPELDISGWDTAQKLMILLTQAVGFRYSLEDVPVQGIAGIDPELVRSVAQVERCIKLVGLVEWHDERLHVSVRPMAVPLDSHLGGVRGENHVVVLQTPESGEMVYYGTGAGTLPVATAVLNDLIGVFDLEHSWTGRYPAAVESTCERRFDQFLVSEKGRIRRLDRFEPGAVPVFDPERP